jgi:hypothetical protein
VNLLLLALLFQAQPPVPRIEGGWWTVANSPDLGPLTRPEQEPVDFAIWQAAGGKWQIWSCIRKTGEQGRTRLFYRWEGQSPLDPDWKPMGIAMRADPDFGETPGGLQAPSVFHANGEYNMFYGDWVNICRARSSDGKTFARVLQPNGRAGIFNEGADSNARDPMVLRHRNRWIVYYTAHPNRDGAVYARTGRTLDAWGPPKIVSKGGRAGLGPFVAECPFVYYYKPAGLFYLFRTQRYGKDAATHVYASKDPLDFGIDNDAKYVTTLPAAAPEIFEFQGAFYIAALRADLNGIQIARLTFAPRPPLPSSSLSSSAP